MYVQTIPIILQLIHYILKIALWVDTISMPILQGKGDTEKKGSLPKKPKKWKENLESRAPQDYTLHSTE